MTKTTSAGGATAHVLVVLVLGVLVLGVGCRAPEQDVDPTASTSPVTTPSTAAQEEAPGFLYGRVTTDDGATYEGRLRWGGGEEAFWGDYFNGVKDENPWAAEAPLEQLTEERQPIEVFGFEVPRGDRLVDLDRPFMARYGDIARIEAPGHGVRAARMTGIAYDPEVRVTLKSGAVFDLDRLSASDFDDGVRVWDGRRGVVDLGPREIRTIELLPTAWLGDAPDRLHGMVRTRQGDFTGFLQWDREAAVGHDELVGRTADGDELRVRFDTIRSISRHSQNSSQVTLLDGREVVLSDTRGVGQGNRGVYVDDGRYGRVLVSWDAFERVDFSAAGPGGTGPGGTGPGGTGPSGTGPAYGDFPPGRPLTGSVTTRAGRRLAGRLVYDLDESETTETLDAPSQGVDYTIPFGLVASVVLPGREGRDAGRAWVTLQSGEALEFERTGDLGEGNGGVLVFGKGRERPEYVLWADVERVDFDRPPAMYPPVGGR